MSRFVLACSLVLSLSSQIAGAQSFASRPEVNDLPHGERRALPTLDRDAVRAKLIENRAANLARFRAYRIAGVYPSNTHKPGLANVWRDAAGHYCAAATIIRASGEIALVASVAEQDNFIRLADVTQGPLHDWILTSGLTQEELAMIQKPFQPVVVKPTLYPLKPIPVDPTLRAAETARLAKLYRQIERRLVQNQHASIELAVDRLMTNPRLAMRLAGLVDG